MTFDEAVAKCRQIESYVIGLPIKGKKITSLFIGPTNWELMCDYVNALNQKGRETAVIEFAKVSFSVYGVSVDNLGSIPNHNFTILDDFDKMMCN